MPVDFLGSGNVPGVVEQDVFVALYDSDVRIVEVLGQPFRAHENFRVHVTLAGDYWIDGGRIGCDGRPHGQLLKEESSSIIKRGSRSCKVGTGIAVGMQVSCREGWTAP